MDTQHQALDVQLLRHVRDGLALASLLMFVVLILAICP